MKHVVLFLAFVAAPAFAPALAQDKPLCIDASETNRYNARPISQREVLAKNAFGHDHRAARLATTCISVGDDIIARTIDGHGARCRITGVKPAAESYADAKYAD